MMPAKHLQAFFKLGVDVSIIAELASRTDVTDVVGEGPVGAQKLLWHFKIFDEQRIPGHELVVGIVHRDALRHIFERHTEQLMLVGGYGVFCHR